MTYVPERGDLVWITFNMQAAQPETTRHPVVVLSPSAYNERVGLALFCPIVSQGKDYPFEVALPPGLEISGVILSDQVKSLNWRNRNATFIGRLPVPIITEVLQKLNTLVMTNA
jgi:mRNA interferase MazF